MVNVSVKKSITIELFDDSPNGIIQCYDAHTVSIAYKIPRVKLGECKSSHEMLKNIGVYILLGTNDEEKDCVYIGQADERKNEKGILNRLQEHDRTKDFWTDAIVFTTKDNSWGQTEICYLENKLYEIAVKAGRYIIKNSSIPSSGHPTNMQKIGLDIFIDFAKLIMGILGYKVFEELIDDEKVQSPVDSQSLSGANELLFYIKLKHGKEVASGKCAADGKFIVFEGSYIKEEETTSLLDGYKKLRIDKKYLIDSDRKLKEDILFKSSSAAASFVLGSTANGKTEWKTVDGILLKDTREI